MGTKFSEDIVPLSDLKVNPGRILDERCFMRAVMQGLLDLEEGREMSLAAVRERLGMR